MLDNYQTNSGNEMRKMWSILNRKHCGISFWHALDSVYRKSFFCSIEPTLQDFYLNFIRKNSVYENLEDYEISIYQYRFLSELMFNLLSNYNNEFYLEDFDDDIKQLLLIMREGLKKCGYCFKELNGKYYTSKIDIIAETIAAENKDYSNDIFDYLIAKALIEKENALTSLSIKLEAVKPFDSYTKNARDYIQMLRHKKERMNDKQYSWFFDKKKYESNLDNLFRILICYIAHINSYKEIVDFDNKSNHKKA